MTSSYSNALAPLGVLYGAATRVRRGLYHAGVFRIHQIDEPVISVGNITTGGTGKTPLVEWIARAVAAEGKRVCILTRGYGRKAPHNRVIVSDGESILTDEKTAGDEPLLLAEKLLGLAAVISDANRVSAANWARENLASEVFILDDGFQYLSLARELNILCIDATNPWGGDRLLPHGRLREPLAEIKRADCIVVTRADQATAIELLESRITQLAGNRPILRSSVNTIGLRPLHQNKIDGDSDRPTPPRGPFAAFCGIGNPQSFFTELGRDGHTLCYSRAFPDHHCYKQADVDEVVDEARRRGAGALVTTEKDAVKLRALHFDIPCYVVEIEIKVDNENRLREIINAAIRAKPKIPKRPNT